MFICLCKHHEWCKHQRSRKCSGHRGSSHCIWAAEIANCLSRLLSHAAGRLPPPVWSSCHLLLIWTLLFFPIASTFWLQTECKFMTSLWYECIKILLLKKRLNKKDFLKKKNVSLTRTAWHFLYHTDLEGSCHFLFHQLCSDSAIFIALEVIWRNFANCEQEQNKKKHMQMQGKSWGQFGSGQKVCVAYGLLQNITENRTRGGLESHFKTSEVDPAKDQAWRTRLDHSKPIKTPSRKKKKKKKKANNSLASSLKSLAGGKTLKLQPLYNQVKRVY